MRPSHTLQRVSEDAEVEAVTEPTRLVLVRHGESNATVERRIAGHRTCSGLSPLGVRQAERLRERLSATGELSVDRLIASTYARAQETAQIVAPALGSDIETDDRFGEHDPGPEMDGLSFQAYVDRFGMPDWNGDPHVSVFPGGETRAEFNLRVGAALSETVAKSAGRTVVIVCHGGVIDIAFRELLRMPPTGSFVLHTLNTSLTEFTIFEPGMWRIVRYNDTAHLAGLPAATATS